MSSAAREPGEAVVKSVNRLQDFIMSLPRRPGERRALDALVTFDREIATLQARLAEVEAERDRARLQANDQMGIAWLHKQERKAAEERVRKLEEAIMQARRGLWWFIENSDEDGNWMGDESQIAERAMQIQDDVLAKALAPEPSQ